MFHFFLSIRLRPHARTRYRYQVFIASSSSQQVPRTPIVLLYEKGYAVRIEPRPPSPNTWRLCARSSRTLFRRQASGDGTRTQGVLGEPRDIVFNSLLIVGQDQTQAHSSSSTRGLSTTRDDGSHIPHIVRPPMPYREFLAEGRASVGLYAASSS